MRDDELWEAVKYDNIPYEGLFVINEGNFMYNNASITYYDIDGKEAMQNVFFNTNGLTLGDVAQSMTIRDSLAYVVLNNSGKIIVLNAYNFQYIGKIIGLDSPRYIHFISDSKAYVSDLYSQSIHIVNPQTLEKTGSINISNPNSNFYQHSSECLLQIDSLIFTNAWSFDNQILVINANTDKLIDSITVTKQPNSMCLDNLNRLWVLSDGGFEGSPYGKDAASLTCIQTDTRKIISEIVFDEDYSPKSLSINATGDTLFYINKDIYYLAIHQMDKPEIFIESPYSESQVGGYYRLGVDKRRKEIYVADAKDNVQTGEIFRYSGNGNLIDQFDAGIIPGNFCFKTPID